MQNLPTSFIHRISGLFNRYRIKQPVLAILCVLLVSACATIPPESAYLSSQIGANLQRQYEIQVDLVNLHFAIKRQDLDKAMEKAVNAYFDGLTPSGSVELTRRQLTDVSEDVNDLTARNNAAKEELEKARMAIIRKLNANYLALSHANASITGLLQSAVKSREAQTSSLQAVSNLTGKDINLDEIFQELDQFILKGGEQAAHSFHLVNQIERLLNQ